MTVTYTPINKCAPGMWLINYGCKFVKTAADVLYTIGTDNRKEMRAELDAMKHDIRVLRDSIKHPG